MVQKEEVKTIMMYQIVDIDKCGVDSVQIVEGTYKLSPNFTVTEVACKDGNEVVIYSSLFMRKAQALRDYIEQPLTANSWFRTKSHNDKPEVGGATNSMHMFGVAADFRTPSGMTDSKFQIIIEHIFGADNTTILYDGRIHVDLSQP